jgi:predicted ABC-type transport system involved in lysophospholipase L1 biosynthesis ATPase subunit
MSEFLFSARGVFKSFTLGRRSIEVLRGVDLNVQRGEFLALSGASGAGKSTLLHLLGGLDVPNRGEIWLGDKNLARLGDITLTRVRNRTIGFVFQAYHLLPELDAFENVILPARIARMPVAEARDRAEQLLGRVGLAERLDHRPYELSGGEQQRVAIARALINEPDVLLADEPTGNLDTRTGDEIIDLLCSLVSERQVTLLVATHDSEVASRAPRQVHLVDGKIAA